MPQSKTTPKKKPAAPSKTTRGQGAGLTIRASGAWRSWLEEAAGYCRTDVSKLIDAAVLDYVRARGFQTAPPKR